MPYSSNFNDGLTAHLEKLWDASISKSTKLTYQSAFKCFQKFLMLSRLNTQGSFLPRIDENHLLYFATFCQTTLNFKYETIKLYLAGIRHFYIRIEGFDPLANNFRLPLILRGIKKSQSNVSRERLPITTDELKDLCFLLSRGVFSPFLDLMLECIFKMAFFGFLRCGEFTCQSQVNSKQVVKIQDISVGSDFGSYVFCLRSSKCDPFSKGVKITIFENNIFSPVKTMVNYLRHRSVTGASQLSPLFIEDEITYRPLTREKFISMLRELLARLGYDTTKFNGHSFRIGAATSAASSGVPDHVIQSLGRWTSDCYIRYIRTDSSVLLRAQYNMCFPNQC